MTSMSQVPQELVENSFGSMNSSYGARGVASAPTYGGTSPLLSMSQSQMGYAASSPLL